MNNDKNMIIRVLIVILMMSLRIKMDVIIAARKKLEAIGLLRTYVKKLLENKLV